MSGGAVRADLTNEPGEDGGGHFFEQRNTECKGSGRFQGKASERKLKTTTFLLALGTETQD